MYRNRYFLNNLLKLIFLGIIVMGCQHVHPSRFSNIEKEALSTFELPPGFKIELVAAEPLVSDPVDITIDAAGNLYVVEMHGYPLDEMGVDDVVMLKDTDGDGIMDKRVVFADSLILPDGIMAWKNGIIVTAAPNILYLEDTTEDGKADIKDTLLTGFALSNPQHNINSPRYGLDNWIYLAHQGSVDTKTYKKKFGDKGRDIYFPDQPEGPRLGRNANGRNVRFRPDKHQIEEMSGYTQFGQTWDEWGNQFLVSNADHIYQEVIANRYLERTPDLLVSRSTQDLSDHGNAADVYPITKKPEHQLLTDVGVFTSACGITDYLGGDFPDKYNKDITFVCEPVSNLIHVDRLRPKGATFIASRILEQKAFLASTDSWFRPVNMYIGPDGALYVVDYYREIIEHPEWLSEDVINSGKLYNGSKKGRIYRISATGGSKAKWTAGLDLKEASNDQLVNKLADKNIWWRMTAQRLLVERDAQDAVKPLVQMTQNKESALGRLHALWTLQGMNRLDTSQIINALKDPVPGIRENAIKLAELHLETDSSVLVPSLIKLKNDQNPKVRFQLLLTLGYINSPKVNEIRQQLLFGDIDDKWVQIAALSASSSQAKGLLDAVLKNFNKNDPAYASLVRRLGSIIGNSQSSGVINDYILRVVNSLDNNENWRAPLLDGLANGVKGKRSFSISGVSTNKLIKVILNNTNIHIKRGALSLLKAAGMPEDSRISHAIKKAEEIAENRKLHNDERAIAIEFLSINDSKKHEMLFKNLLVPQEPLPVQLAALQAFTTIPGLDQSRYLISKWTNLSPSLRSKTISYFLGNPEKVSLLLDAMEDSVVRRSDISWPQSVSIMVTGDTKQKERARLLLGKKNTKRKSVIEDYTSALQLIGDAKKGKIVFARNCSMCHQIRGKLGRPFGPDLGTVQSWDEKTILANVLDPDMSISRGYDTWMVELQTGGSFQGIITSETPVAITLENENGEEKTVSRDDIVSLKALGLSAMPVGLEDRISKQEMINLITFLRKGGTIQDK